jgi:multiple antibiotic resistance protein
MGPDSDAAGITRDFLMFFATIDPVGTLALFVALMGSVPVAERARTAVRAVLYSGGILLGFMAFGQLVLNGLGIRLMSFQLAGGIILFLFGLKMVLGSGEADEGAGVEPGRDVAVFPLAIPSIAGPGAIVASVVLTDNDRFAVGDQVMTALMLIAVLALTLGALLLADRIYRLIGASGSAILVRIMGIVLTALATQETLESVDEIVRTIGR